MAQKMNWFNASRDAYEPDVFEQAEAEFPTTTTNGFCYSNGKPVTGVFGYEAALMRELDHKEARARARAYAR